MRFACPSSSSLSASDLGACDTKFTNVDQVPKEQPPKPLYNGHHDARHKRETYKHRATKIKEAGEAKRKQVHKLKQHVRCRHGSHVYIGNLEGTVTVELLQQHFAGCGPIKRTTLRMSRGQAVNVGVAVPTAVRSTRDRKYATMEFYEPTTALNAIKLDGSTLEGLRIVVSTAAGDLPEVADIAKPQLQKLRGELERPALLRFLNVARPLARHDTEIDYSDPANDRHRFFGFSFAKTVV